MKYSRALSRGLATYFSWMAKWLATIYAFGAGVGWWAQSRDAEYILIVTLSIMSPFVPIDISKVRQSVLPIQKELPNETSGVQEGKE